MNKSDFMIKRTSLLLCLITGITIAFAQAPGRISYQAAVRNSSGNPVPQGTTVNFRFSISDQLVGGTLLYQETQSKTTANSTGLVNLEIGGGTATFGAFPSSAQWGAGNRYLKVELDASGGSSFTEMSNIQLVSVPYALHAGHAAIADSASGVWQLEGNIGIDSNAHFIGTKDGRGFSLRTNNQNRIKITSTGWVGIGTSTPGRILQVNGEAKIDGLTVGQGGGNGATSSAVGMSALYANTNGFSNTAMGYQTLMANTTGNYNTALGREVLRDNTGGDANTGTGSYALYNNTGGSNNAATGYFALVNNSIGNSNVAVGHSALYRNSTRSNLVAIGDSALYNNGIGVSQYFHAIGNTAVGSKTLMTNTTGYNNTAIGFEAMLNNTSGGSNTAIGYSSLYSNTTGQYNTAIGFESGVSNTSGNYLTALGYRSLQKNTTGTYNTGVGYGALNNSTTGTGNTAAGYGALANNTTGDYNTALGFLAAVNSGDLRYSAAIGAYASVSATRTMVFGRQDSVLHWAFGRYSAGSSSYAMQVGTNSTNGNGAHLSTGGAWTNASDINLKSDIRELSGDEILSKVKQLNITRWKYTGTEEYHIGPMAQQFYQLFGTGTDDHSISTIDPAGVALKAIQEQQKIIEELKAQNASLVQRIEKLESEKN